MDNIYMVGKTILTLRRYPLDSRDSTKLMNFRKQSDFSVGNHQNLLCYYLFNYQMFYVAVCGG